MADGQSIASSTSPDGDLTYFVSAGGSLPDELVVLGPAGEDLGRFTPAADAAQARTTDKTAISHE